MAFHTKTNKRFLESFCPSRSSIQTVIFLCRLLTPAERNYWLTELEIAEISHKHVKAHIVPAASSCLASANPNLSSLDPEYSELDALFTYTTTLVDIHSYLIKRIIDSNQDDECWLKLLPQIEDNKTLVGDKAIFSFVKGIPMPTDSDLYFTSRPELPHPISREVFHRSSFSGRAELAFPVGLAQTSNTSYLEPASDRDPPPLEYPEPGVETEAQADKREPLYHVDKLTGVYRLCIPTLVATEIITLAHNAGHPGFSRCFEIITCS